MEGVPGLYCLWVQKEMRNYIQDIQKIIDFAHFFINLDTIFQTSLLHPLVVPFYMNSLKIPLLWPFKRYIPILQPFRIKL